MRIAKTKKTSPAFISSTPGPHKPPARLPERHGLESAQGPNGIGMAQRENLSVLLRARQSELQSHMLPGQTFGNDA